MAQHIQALTSRDIPTILDFERTRLLDDPDSQMAAWSAPWRPESLEHYCHTGWSVGVWDSDQCSSLQGYFLGQALPFFCGLTQVLWVEFLSWDCALTQDLLMDTAIRYAKDKHLQSVFFSGSCESGLDIEKWRGRWNSQGFWEIQTTRR